jgi:two-component system, chemotaxis family, protein-glutamate methylesterase/glutaminase
MICKTKKNIRVLVVDDSPLICKLIAGVLNSDSEILVVGIAGNGKEALDIVPDLKPDIIILDIHMPVMDGFELTKQIMAYYPTPIIIVSTSVFEDMNKVFKAISFGALDVIDKNSLEFVDNKEKIEEFIEKVKFLSSIKVLTHPLAKSEKSIKRSTISKHHKKLPIDGIIAIAASTGGPQALYEILKKLPADFPLAIVIVQHITSGFDCGLAEWLNNECRVNVKTAENLEKLQPGTAYIAPCNVHMKVKKNGIIELCDEPAVSGHKPSADVLLESVSRIYQKNAVAAILTGMGADGANGIKAVKKMKGLTIAQNESSCIVFGMPKVAIEMNVIDKVLPLEKIAEEILSEL